MCVCVRVCAAHAIVQALFANFQCQVASMRVLRNLPFHEQQLARAGHGEDVDFLKMGSQKKYDSIWINMLTAAISQSNIWFHGNIMDYIGDIPAILGKKLGFNGTYPLVNIKKSMENHHFFMGKSKKIVWPCSIANCYFRG